MAKSTNDSRIMEQKDTISQLNMVISSQNELTTSLRSTVEECNATISSLREQVEYLTRKLFGTSSGKSKTVAGQLNLFDEAEQEAQLPVIILYKYTETRTKFNAMEFLGSFSGYLETDCYQRI